MTVGLLDFSKFKHPVAQQFARMSKHELFCVDVDKDAMWNTYLDSFPDGTNNMYRKRREYDCSCCRSFIKRVGNVVAIIDGKLETLWDAPTGVPAFDQVSRALAALVRQQPIDNAFLSPERSAGLDKNWEQLTEKDVREWTHFFVNIPAANTKKGADIGPALSEKRASHDVLLRSLTELSDDSVAMTRELIAQGSLYRGEEHANTLASFASMKHEFNKLSGGDRDLFVWHMLKSASGAVARIRNTAIGTLLIDLSAGLDLEDAVRKYEAVVAPQNYKRPTALVTQKMVENAKSAVDALGLTSALQRRYATLDDLSATNLLYIDRNSTFKTQADSDAFAGVAASGGSKQFDKVEPMAIDDFIVNVLPKARTLEVMFDGSQTGSLMSLVTAADPSAARLFKWDNAFSWSYNGDVADSIKERVKQAGGNVTGDLCCRLAWFNYDDLDLHMGEPGYEIYFGNRALTSPSGGRLDVDMNAGSGQTRTPVENIFYKDRSTMRKGKYCLAVHQFAKRETKDPGFEIEIDLLGQVTRFSYTNPLPTGKTVKVAVIHVDNDGSIHIESLLDGVAATREVWGIKTNAFHRVRAMCLSPNHWDGQGVGNKHYFFMLDGCKADQPARGFYNEFLRPDLEQHRKVLEIVGSKMRADGDNQLSGLGFSSTKRASVLVRVAGTFNRVVKLAI